MGALAGPIAVAQPRTAEYLTSGTWTCPAGVTSADVLLLGGGGGGGGGNVASESGGGGGAGAYARKMITVVPLTVYTITIGAGGAAGAQGANGGTGGSSALVKWSNAGCARVPPPP